MNLELFLVRAGKRFGTLVSRNELNPRWFRKERAENLPERFGLEFYLIHRADRNQSPDYSAEEKSRYSELMAISNIVLRSVGNDECYNITKEHLSTLEKLVLILCEDDSYSTDAESVDVGGESVKKQCKKLPGSRRTELSVSLPLSIILLLQAMDGLQKWMIDFLITIHGMDVNMNRISRVLEVIEVPEEHSIENLSEKFSQS